MCVYCYDLTETTVFWCKRMLLFRITVLASARSYNTTFDLLSWPLHQKTGSSSTPPAPTQLSRGCVRRKTQLNQGLDPPHHTSQALAGAHGPPPSASSPAPDAGRRRVRVPPPPRRHRRPSPCPGPELPLPRRRRLFLGVLSHRVHHPRCGPARQLEIFSSVRARRVLTLLLSPS